MNVRDVYEFGEFVLDARERQLLKGPQILSLAPKALDLLVVLVRQAGHLVTKRELLELVWSDAHVEEGILAVHISALRKALGDSERKPQYIATVPRAGYRFLADVRRRREHGPTEELRRPVWLAPVQPAVCELIGRGRAFLLTTSASEIPKAIASFQSALELDATSAAAHAGLARAYCMQAELRTVPHAKAYSDAKSAALHALAMDDECADAQVALGGVMFLSEWNWVGARRTFERALQLDPGHTEAYLLYGRLLEAFGDFEGSLATKQKALERHPSSAMVHLEIGLCYWNWRRYDELIEWANKALALDARHTLAREYVAAAYWKKGDFDRQMSESLAHAESHGAPHDALLELTRLYARGGRRAVLEHTVRHASSSHPGGSVLLALLHAELGNHDEAFRFLDRAIDHRDPCLVHLAVSPQWDDLRVDSRFDERVARMGLTRF